jgi:hypothetical protein
MCDLSSQKREWWLSRTLVALQHSIGKDDPLFI